MPQKLETVLKHVEKINNDINRQLIYEKSIIIPIYQTRSKKNLV
jgi:hypothetical protein